MKSRAVYPYPVLVIHGCKTVEWRATGEAKKFESHQFGDYVSQAGKLVPVTRDVRLSFYQTIDKPWDWDRARRLADAMYAEHGPIKIVHDGQTHRPSDAPTKRQKPAPARQCRQAILDYLAGKISRADLERIAA